MNQTKENNFKSRPKKVNVSVGIPAYNEASNIKQLLLSLLSQDEINFTLKEIIIVSDCSTDNTISEVLSVKSKKINLLQNKKRIGQALTQNRFIEKFQGDILLLLNADVLPGSKTFISNIIKPFLTSDEIGIVCPKLIPVKSDHFFGKMMNYAAACKWQIVESWNNRSNLVLCSGAARAFSGDLIRQMRWPKVMGEDAYSYFFCITHDYKFYYQPTAKIFYKPADNFKDQINQSTRFIVCQEEMANFFPEDLVKKSYHIPLHLEIIHTLRYFLKDPILMGSYLLYFLLVNLNPQKNKFRSITWDISKSSKILIPNEN